ncbi:MAG: DUF2934 domain-containing protein [Steroidobacteraceae bacterium]
MGIDPEPREVLMLKARALIEKLKAESAALHQQSASPDQIRLHVTNDLAKLRDAVDREIDRRVDEDLADNVCDLLEHLSGYLYAETGVSPEPADDVDMADNADAKSGDNTPASNEAPGRRAKIAEAAYLRAERRHFEPGHDMEDWLAAESAVKPSRSSPSS